MNKLCALHNKLEEKCMLVAYFMHVCAIIEICLTNKIIQFGLKQGRLSPPRPLAQIPPQSHRPSHFYGVRFSVHGETASAEGTMLRLPKARSPSRLRGLGSVVSSPAESGAEPQKPQGF